jgi:hypothetical protein
VTDDRLAFPLETLLTAAHQRKPLTVCDRGHLVVAGRTHWQPVRLTPDLHAIVCEPVTHQRAAP